MIQLIMSSGWLAGRSTGLAGVDGLILPVHTS